MGPVLQRGSGRSVKPAISPRLRGALCVIIAGCSWGFSGTCSQFFYANSDAPAIWLTCVRALAGGILLTLAAIRKGSPDLKAIWREPGEALYLVGYAIFGLMSSQFCYLSCISYANAPTATVLQTLATVLTMLISCLTARRLPRGNEALSLVLAVLGTTLLATRGDFTKMQFSSGVLFWGAAIAVAGTAYNLLPKRLLDRWDRDVVLSYGMLIGGTVLSLASRLWAIEVHIAPVGYLALASILLFGALIPFPLFFQGLVDIGPVRSAILMAAEPLMATLLSTVWLKTRFTPGEWVGIISIVAIIFLLAKPNTDKKKDCP